MTESKMTIFTGGAGLLGTEFQRLRPDLHYPSEDDFNITRLEQMRAYVAQYPCERIVHAAAFTSPPLIDKDPETAIDVNIIGTCNVVKLCREIDARLVYICTDYVFDGSKGNYKEEDPVSPVNKYAWSKLGGECAVRLYDKSLIIRTTFGPNEFPYEKAFVDQWTSRESVSKIAGMISQLLDANTLGVVHVGGARKTVMEFARGLDPAKSIGELSINDVSFSVPVDTSLNCDRFRSIVNSSDGKGEMS